MASRSENTVAAARVPGNPMVPCLYAMAILIAAVSVIGGLFKVAALLTRRGMPVGIDEVLFVVLLAVGGLALALGLAGLATVVHYLQNQVLLNSRLIRLQEDILTQLAQQRAQPVAAPPPVESPSGQTAWIDSQRLEHIHELLQDMNENLLLSPEQRQSKRRQYLNRLHEELAQTLTSLLGAGKFPEAQRRLDEYILSFPEEKEVIARFQCQIDQARASVEESDCRQAAQRVRDFMAAAAWPRAEEVLQELFHRHPNSPRVRELAASLRQERVRFEQQHCRQTLAQIEEFLAQKEYRHAWRFASELVSRYPSSPEAQVLRDKMDTLRTNAEIATRRDLEERLKEMVRTGRYIEALGLSQEIISQYPDSPQAKVLKDQMPQLLSKAKLQMEQPTA